MKERIGQIYIWVAIGWLTFCIIGLFFGFLKTEWTKSPKKIDNTTENFWHCFSKDGRINWVIVKSTYKPDYLASPGNENAEFYCEDAKVIDFSTYSRRQNL